MEEERKFEMVLLASISKKVDKVNENLETLIELIQRLLMY